MVICMVNIPVPWILWDMLDVLCLPVIRDLVTLAGFVGGQDLCRCSFGRFWTGTVAEGCVFFPRGVSLIL